MKKLLLAGANSEALDAKGLRPYEYLAYLSEKERHEDLPTNDKILETLNQKYTWKHFFNLRHHYSKSVRTRSLLYAYVLNSAGTYLILHFATFDVLQKSATDYDALMYTC